MFSNNKKASGDICKEYKVVDYYDGVPECLGYADTPQEACSIRRQRLDDTDGECKVVIKQRQPQGGYKVI